jgi:hypothetical protein
MTVARPWAAPLFMLAHVGYTSLSNQKVALLHLAREE